ncbi:MAG: type II toxin-antitoxin system Phd/YefM family antitoxin [Gemmatimonadaceae bacterium]
MSKQEMPQNEVRANLTEVINQAIYSGQITIITRRGKAAAAIVPMSLIPQEPVMTVTLFETNSDLLVIAKGNEAWSLHLAGDHMEGMFAKDAEAWISGDWEPSEADGQSPTDIDDDLTAVAEWTALGGVRLLDTGRDNLGAAAKDYIGPDAYIATVGEDNAEWLSGTHGPTAQYDKSVRITDLGDGKIRVPADAINILLGLNESWDGVVDKENGVLRIYIEGTAFHLTPAEDE